MDIATWIIFAAVALFFDVAVNWWKRQQKNAELQRRVEQYDDMETDVDKPAESYEVVYTDRSFTEPTYQIERPVDERYGRPVSLAELESTAPIEIQTYDEDVRQRVGRKVSVRELGERGVAVPVENAELTPRRTVTRLKPRAQAPAMVRHSTRQTLTLNAKTVREAIVWREVLGPPKGLQSI